MAKKSRHDKLIDDAVKAGNWGRAENASNRDLRQLGANLRAGHNLPQHDTRDILPDDLPEDDTPSEELEESVDPYLDLGDIEAEEPFECLRDAYEAYSKAGGNRCIREKVLRYFDAIEIKAIDRTMQRKAAEELFSDFGEHIWDEEILAPITEVRKFWLKQRSPAKAGHGRPWCGPDYHDSGARYPRAWGINKGYRGFRDGKEPAPFRPGLRVRHLTGQRYARVPDVDCVGTRCVRILRERPWSTDQWLGAGASFWEQLEVLPKGSDRVALEPYCQWARQSEPKGPHPFEVLIAREERLKHLPPRAADERADAAEVAAEREHQLARLELALDSTLGSKITREQARLICKRDQSVPARHDAPLPLELAKPTTAKQWEDYRLAQYTTGLGQPRGPLIEACAHFERPAFYAPRPRVLDERS